MNALVALLVKYLESNPAQVDQLVAALVDALIQHLNNQAATPPAKA